ncbi:hypothetical protein HDU82_006871 [Entophlyctis luteolus]|nr:hypothetical protein HDU82_006871 [Entophlyctis luteolus]
MPVATFFHIDPTTIAVSEKPWAKVDCMDQSYRTVGVQREVQNVRGREHEFGTDKSGFAFVSHASAVSDFSDEALVRGEYYAEVESLVKATLGASRVVIFDHTIRRNDGAAARQPVQSVHVDQTPAAAVARVRRHTGADADTLLQTRFQIVNVWRPIAHPATDLPLALVDWRSTKESDFVGVDLLYPERQLADGVEVLPDSQTLGSTDGYKVVGETFSVRPSDDHRFFYLKDMRPNEVAFIKCYDSRSEWEERGGVAGIARGTPHTAFVDPETPDNALPRQSIEVRCLVFYESE